MNKSFRLLLCVLIAAFTYGITNAATDRDGNRFIYLAGPETIDAMPIASDSAKWASNRMFETAPGSNVYEITKDVSRLTWGRWIRFYSDFADGLSEYDSYKCYSMNQILPAGGKDIPVTLTNGTYFYSGLIQPKYSNLSNSFILPDSGIYRIRVDLNNNSVLIIPKNTYLAIINDEFSFDRISEYPNFESLASYCPAGDLKFRIYHPFDASWVFPKYSDDATVSNKSYQEIIVTTSQTAGTPFSVPNWKGGVLKGRLIQIDPNTGEGVCVFSATPDVQDIKFTPMDLPAIYIAGNFNYWTLTAIDREPGTEAIYKINLPAGTTDFKTLIGDNWANDAIGSNGLKPEVANGIATYGLYIDTGLYIGNHNFTTPLAQDMVLTYNLTKGTATIEASAGLNLLSTVPNVTVDRDQLFVQTPYQSILPSAESSDAVLSCFPALAKQADGSYYGRFFVPDGQFKMRFINSLNSKSTPNGIIAPPAGKDRELVVENGLAYSSAENLNESNAGYWTYTPDYLGWKSSYINVTVFPGEKPSVKFELPNNSQAEETSMLYVVGTPNNWNIDQSDLILRPTDKGGFYGYFDASAGEQIFRFYSKLGDWESNSYGYVWYDMIEDYWDPATESVHTANCAAGKGSYGINNWPGGTIYVYVDLANSSVKLSANPIEGVGEFIDPANAKHVYLYDERNNSYIELEKKSGLYILPNNYNTEIDKGINLRLFTKKLPISTEEPEWEGSYALSSLANVPVAFDDCNVAEFDFELKDSVNTTGANPFMTTPDKNGLRYTVAVDLENKKLYLERIAQSIIMYGDVTDGKLPTYATRTQFKDYILKRSGSRVNIPANKAKFVLVTSFADVSQALLQQIPVKVDLSSGYYSGNPDMNGFTPMSRNNLINIPDWKGGDLIVNYSCIVDPTKISDVSAYAYSSDVEDIVKLTPSTPGSLIFKGKAKFNGNSSITFRTFENDSIPLSIGSIVLSYGVGYSIDVNHDADKIIPVNGTANAQLGFGTWRGFNLNSLVGSGEYEIILDLNQNTLTVNVPENNTGSVYEVVSQNNNSLDGTYGFESDKKDDCIVVTAQTGSQESDTEQTAEFNLTTPNGDVIVPATGKDTDIKFDANGTWTGKYTSTSVASRNRAIMRRAAAEMSKWRMNIPAGESSQLSMLVDEANSTITIFSTAHNRRAFVISRENYEKGRFGIEYIDELKQHTLTKVYDGYYQSDYTIPEFRANELHEFAISTDVTFNRTVRPLFAEDNVLDVTGEDRYAEQIISEYYLTNFFGIISPVKSVNLTLDWNMNYLRALYNTSGIEETQTETDEISIKPVRGGIIINTTKEAYIAIYTLTGQLADICKAAPGTTMIELPTGFYIVNGQKMMIRQ